MTTHATTLPDAQIRDLERLYQFQGRDDVIAFLEQYPALVPVLLEAPAKIAEYFPVQTLYLNMALDPEEEGLDHLALNIVTPLDADESFPIEMRLIREWGVDAFRRAQHKMTTYFRSPEAYASV